MSLKRFILKTIVILAASSVLVCQDDDLIFENVNQHLTKYRQTISPGDLEIKNGVLRLQLAGRRTNYNSLMLLGFFAIGRTISTMDIQLYRIEVVIQVNIRDGRRVSAWAAPGEVVDLARGRINSEHFFQQIGF